MSSGIEEVISSLYEMVQDAWSLPLGADKCVLERDKVLDLLDEINNQLPAEFKQAKTIVDARNEVITNARREAESMLKQAEQKAKQMTSEHEVYQQAQIAADKLMADTKEQAEAVVKSTQDKLKELRKVTNNYVLDALKQTEAAVANALHEVETARSKFEVLANPDAKKVSQQPEEAAEAEAPAEEAEVSDTDTE